MLEKYCGIVCREISQSALKYSCAFMGIVLVCLDYGNIIKILLNVVYAILDFSQNFFGG